MKRIVLRLIRLYQKTLSPDHGLLSYKHPHGFCRFKPTCSEYAHKAVSKYGVTHGIFLFIKRIVRCNPWSRGGWDPIQ